MPTQQPAVVAVEAGAVAPPAAERPEGSPEAGRRWRRGLQPLGAVAMVPAAPATGVGPTSNRVGRPLLAALAALTVIAALRRQYPTVRLGAALTAPLAAFTPPPWRVAWWPLPGLVGVGAYPDGGVAPAPTGPLPEGGARAHGRSSVP